MNRILASDNISHLHEYDIDYNNNELYLVGTRDYVSGIGIEETEEPGIEFIIANKFIKNLRTLENASSKPITIHMATCGGDWHAGMQIFDAIKRSNNYITIINYTHARSMSSLIFLAADERLMQKHSTFMFHEGTIATSGTQRQFRTEFREAKKTHKQMLDIYVNAIKDHEYWKESDEKRIKTWLNSQMRMHEEVYLTSEEAVKMGFATGIIE